MNRVDLNCDLGESFGAYKMGMDQEVLPLVTSVNIACGFHAGDPSTMRETVQRALEHGVAIGAHPGLPDLIGFGRRNLDISPQEAYDMVIYQIGALSAFVKAAGGNLQHVKPHGALYNMAAKRADLAEAIAEAVYRVDGSLTLYGLPASELTKAGQKVGLRVAGEVFADRTYQADGTLTPRNQPDAFVHDPSEAVQNVLQMIEQGTVRSQQGVIVPIQADTVCIHGDGPQAVQFAKQLREGLLRAGIEVLALSAHSQPSEGGAS